MTIRLLAAPVVVAAMLSVPAQAQLPQVTDVSSPAAEERASTGAVVLEKSLVRAQRGKSFEESSARTGVGSVGRGVLRATFRSQTKAELASAREAEAAHFYEHGAGSLTAK